LIGIENDNSALKIFVASKRLISDMKKLKHS
jgi:hypothetical protein